MIIIKGGRIKEGTKQMKDIHISHCGKFIMNSNWNKIHSNRPRPHLIQFYSSILLPKGFK